MPRASFSLGLDSEGIAVLPGGDHLIEAQAAHLPEGRKLRFDSAAAPRPTGPGVRVSENDVKILEILPAGAAGSVVRYAVRDQPVVARLPLVGVHNAVNGAAALAVAVALGVPAPEAARALADTVLPPHRSFPMAVAGRIVLDDCYNANPASMRAALGVVTSSATSGSMAGGQGRAFAILGDMLELGPDAPEQHRAMGREAGACLAGLAVVGSLGAQIARGAREVGLDPARVMTTDDPMAAAATVASWTRPGDWILVKASRGMRLERAIDVLSEASRFAPATVLFPPDRGRRIS